MWIPLCADGFKKEEADTICKQLGYMYVYIWFIYTEFLAMGGFMTSNS